MKRLVVFVLMLTTIACSTEPTLVSTKKSICAHSCQRKGYIASQSIYQDQTDTCYCETMHKHLDFLGPDYDTEAH